MAVFPTDRPLNKGRDLQQKDTSLPDTHQNEAFATFCTAVSRREFLQASMAVGLMTGLGSLVPAYARQNTNIGRSRGGENRHTTYDLTIAEVELNIDGRRTTVTAINGSVPGPLLRFREGDIAILRVTNALSEDTSIHWHGIILPFGMDGVPGVSFSGIKPGETFTYRFPVQQSGTYWYHSHSGLQEQTGVYGPIIIDPAEAEPQPFDREYVIVLGDWTFENPHTILRKLRKQPGYFNYQRRTLLDLFRKGADRDVGDSVSDRLRWGKMRMDATDIADVTGNVYTYLMNGLSPDGNWTGLFEAGECVRLRFINAGAGTFFDVRIPGLPMTVVQADGQNIQPVTVDEFRIAIAETYDVIVEPAEDRAYTIFAESMDRSGFASGTLSPSEGLTAPIPERRKRPLRSMRDMGMEHGNMEMTDPGPMSGMDHGDMAGHDMQEMAMVGMTDGLAPAGSIPATVPHSSDSHGPGNAAVPMQTMSRLSDPGIGLGTNGWRVLLYSDLKSLLPTYDQRAPEREIELHLTGNMDRYMWSFDGKEYSKSRDPIQIGYQERVRITLVNDTMMEHPIHLHGMWMELENGAHGYLPKKHTVNVKPAERLSVLVSPDSIGPWAMHCHILYHMEMGMFRVVQVSQSETAEVKS